MFIDNVFLLGCGVMPNGDGELFSMTYSLSISVIIPTFNRADMVCRCVQSILDTGWPELEVVVVDDCSPDDTAERVKAKFVILLNISGMKQTLSRQFLETTERE